MAEYNLVLAVWATLTSTGEPVLDSKGREYAVLYNKVRFEEGKNWIENNINNEELAANEEMVGAALGRVLNRIMVNVKRDDCLTAKKLTTKLLERLGINEILPEAKYGLLTIILGFYDGAESALGNVNIQMLTL
jgi:hypothetical protein